MQRASVSTAYKSYKLLAPALAWLVFAVAPGMAAAQISLRSVVELAQKNSGSVRIAQADVEKASAQASQARDAFVPSISFGSGLPAFPEVGFTGSLPSIWDSKVQSMVFSMPQIRYIKAARVAERAAQLALKDAREQVALDASTAYIELDTVNSELEAARAQEQFAARLVAIEQQRTDAGVDPLSALLQAKLTAAQLRLNRLHMESRAATLAKQLAVLTGLPVGSVVPDHTSIPEVPAVSADRTPITMPGIESSQELARSRLLVAKGDEERQWFMPEVAFGLIYNRNTTLLNNIKDYFNPAIPFPANNLSSGFSINVPLFDWGLRDKAKESAAEALRAKVEAEQAQRQNDIQITMITSSLRELDAEAEVASLKQQIAGEQLKAVMAQLEVGNGAVNVPGAPPQLSPTAEQQARIDERQKYEEALDAGFDLSKARLSLLRALGHMQDWLNELQATK
jgi:outer membrane protein TolC